MARKLIIAIDGPAGAGKSTIAAHLARKYGYVNLETGAMYRALALKAIESGTSVDDEAGLVRLAGQSHIELQPTSEENRVLLDEKDVSHRIRQADVTDAASRVSVHPSVREWMVRRQRELGRASRTGVVMEGRDIGTKVFPDADIKIFLDAQPDIRAERRLRQVGGVSDQAQVQSIAEQMRMRDQRDKSRTVSPLVAADDAFHIDSTALSIDDVIRFIDDIIHSKLQTTATASQK